MKLHIIIHADPDYQNQTITAKGHLEAEALAKVLAKEAITHIYSSPFKRAVNTMNYTTELLGIEGIIEPWTQELNWVVLDTNRQREAVWNNTSHTIRDGQSPLDAGNWAESKIYKNCLNDYEQLKKNSDAFLNKHGYERQGAKYRIVEPNQHHIAVFCHLGFGLTWLAHLLELPLPLVWSSFWLAPSSVTTLIFEERQAGWAVPRCIQFGGTSHLTVADLPLSTAGLCYGMPE